MARRTSKVFDVVCTYIAVPAVRHVFSCACKHFVLSLPLHGSSVFRLLNFNLYRLEIISSIILLALAMSPRGNERDMSGFAPISKSQGHRMKPVYDL